jgi:hypothetical protein
VPRTYYPEFRRRLVELVQGRRPVRVAAAQLGLAQATEYRWKAQDLIDRVGVPKQWKVADLTICRRCMACA